MLFGFSSTKMGATHTFTGISVYWTVMIIVVSSARIVERFTINLDETSAENNYLNGYLDSPVELIRAQGFPAETHVVETEDGYLLTLHRIPHGRNATIGKGVVLLYHGILSSSDSWLLRTSESDFAFLLADRGYDVWLANSRGNTHSRKHKFLNPNTHEFWKFGFHELGYYDLPATIDYILNVTDQNDLIFTGHSMGCLVSYIMCATRPEYNDKIRLNVGFGPLAFTKVKNMVQLMIIDGFKYFKEVLELQGIYEIFPRNTFSRRLGRAFCEDGSFTQNFCANSLFTVIGNDYLQLNMTMLPKILSHFPSGSSIQTYEHLQQLLNTGECMQQDFGVIENLRRYGKRSPPSYNFQNIRCPVAIYYGLNDFVTSPEEVAVLGQHLPNLVGLFRVPFDQFNHLDFLWAMDARRLLYDPLIEELEKYAKS